VARATGRSRVTEGGPALKHGGRAVSRPALSVPPDSVQTPFGPPAPRPALKDRAVGAAESRTPPTLRALRGDAGKLAR